MKKLIILFVFLSIYFCFAQWIPINSGTSKTLRSVCFIDSTTGWIVGDSGTVLKSVDGGKNWESISLGMPQNLYSIQLINQNYGWIVGDSGKVLKTTNAGTDWQIQNSGTDKALFSVFFIDTLTGWCVGDSGIIINTADGGLSWLKQESGVNSQLRSVYFSNSQTGRAVGNHKLILLTSNGGTTWSVELSSLLPVLNSVFITKMGTGWAAGGDLYNHNYLILKKQISESTWLTNCLGYGEIFNSIQFVDENTGYVAGEAGVIIKTINGGDIWRSQISNTAKNLYSIFFADSIRGWAVGDSGTILTTVTGGVQLPPQPSLVYPENGAKDMPLLFTLFWNECADADHYQVQLSLDSNFNSIVIDSIITNTIFQLSDLMVDTTYYWRANANNIVGKSEWSEIRNFKTIFPIPELIAPKNNAYLVPIYPVLQWQEYPGIEAYELNVSTDGIYGKELVYTEKTLVDNSIQISGLRYGRRYYWRVRMIKGNKTSNWSEEWEFCCEEGPAGWYSQNSNTTVELNTVQFIDENTGWIVGNSGTILKTDNGGISWQSVSGISNTALESIYFINPDTGWVVGQDGSIYKTTDGGTTWNNYSINENIHIYAVHFPNENHGWITGCIWNGTSSEGRILKTTDGGISWSDQTPETLPELHSVYFVNDSTGWAVGGNDNQNMDDYQYIILKTVNGGATWEKTQGIHSRLRSVFFTDSYNGWAVGLNGFILKTTNAGASWKECNFNPESDLLSIYFIDSNVGWASGSHGRIISTQDGGNAWTLEFSGTENHLKSIFFMDSGTGWAAGYNGEIIKTTTGGLASIPILKSPGYDAIGVSDSTTFSWNKIDGIDNYRIQVARDINLKEITFDDYCRSHTIKFSGLEKNTRYYWRVGAVIFDQSFGWSEIWTFQTAYNWLLLNSGTNENLFTIYFLNKSTGWAAGDNQTIIKTNDGGNNWEICYQKIQEMYYLNFIYFVNSSVGWVAGNYGTIMKTSDGGETWNSQSSGTTIHLESCYFFDDNNGIVVGGGWDDATNSSKSIILRTSNGGLNWTMEKRSSPSQLTDITFIDSTGWITTGDGYILKSTNYGKDWRKVNTGASQYLESICFINADIGWAAGAYNPVLKTTDGGETWSRYNVNIDQWIYSICFGDSKNGWLSVEGGLYSTTDGGEHWQIEYESSYLRIYSFSFANTNTGWLSGNNGLILKTANADIAAIGQSSPEIPLSYRLFQNYPNPFNPITTIRYDIAKTSYVIIQIFNINGQVVETLVHRQQEPGSYSINWNATKISSGIYLYRLQAGDFQQVRKCLIVK